MELKYKKMKKTLIIKIFGEIDHHTSKELRQQIETALAEMGGRNIIFDLENVGFMDSSGIGMMIGRYKQLQTQDGRMCIICTNKKIVEITELSGLRNLFPIFKNIEDAWSFTEGRETNAI